MFNVLIDYLPEDDEVAVVKQTTSGKPAPIEAMFTGEDVRRFHEVVQRVPIAEDIIRYAVRLAAASRPGQASSPGFVNDWVSWGAGTRAGQYVVLGAKARALLAGRNHATADDVRALLHPTLRHRILVGYRAEAEGVTVETVIDRLLETVEPPGK
jgi:MoxR-like ATPase